MKSHWRKTLVIAPLLAAALLVSVSGSAWAANVVRVEIYSPTKSSPVRWVRPGSIVTVTTWVTVDEAASVTVGANVGNADWYSVTRLVTVPSSAREFSVSVPLPERIADGSNNVSVMAWTYPDGGVKQASESDAVYVDGTAPVVTLGALPTTPTTNPRPTWTWSGVDALSGLDYYIVTLDGELPFRTTGTSFTPSSNLADGKHVLKVKAVDKAGNIGTEQSFPEVTISTTPPEAPAIATLAAGYNTSPIAIDWNDVTDGSYPITYALQYANNAEFSGAISQDCSESGYSFDAKAAGEGGYWFRVKTISTVNGSTTPKQTKKSDWSAIVSTIYDVIGPAAAVLKLESKSPTNQPTQEWSWSRPVDAVDYDVYWSNSQDHKPPDVVDPNAENVRLGVGNIDLYETSFGEHNEMRTYYVWVRGIDALGNPGDWSNQESVTVDMKAPGVPENLHLDPTDVTIRTIDGKTYINSDTPTVAWSPVTDLDIHKYVVEIDGQAWIDILGPFEGLTEISYQFTEGLAEVGHTVKVKAVDALGNESAYSAPLVFTVDVTPPEAPGMPRTESPAANRRPIWTWNATSGALAYRVFLDGVAQQPADTEPNPNGTPQSGTTFTPATDLADGWHDLQVTAIDALGNESAKSAAGSVLIDSTAPAVPDMAHLLTQTRATQVVFRWVSIGDVVGYNFSYIVGDGEEWTTIEGITTQSHVVKGPDGRDLRDGEVVQGKVQAYDGLQNTSEWSGVESTTIDLAAPTVRITAPDGAKNTNLSTFTWTWTGDDGERGSGVQGYWVRLNDEAWSWTMQPVFTSWRLQRGENVLHVKGVDNLGNESAATEAPAVTLVDVAIFDVMPAPGEHLINEVSTIVFSVAGLYDGRVEVLLSNKPIEDAWRLVTIVNTPGLAKFYVLLDDAVMQPGPLTVIIKIGNVTRFCDYEMLDERSGFGFGRLRPW